MRVGGVAALLFLLAQAATAQNRANTADMPSCLEAATAAELEWRLPPGVLAAIGRIESGRWNPATGRVEPWPWTVNAAGAGRYHPSLQAALTDVVREQTAGVRSVDVGCFQINLMYHPAAFASLEEAFDPLANARYAARFLSTLRSNAGTWDLAVAQYHSAVPEIGGPYRQHVMASWQGDGVPATTAIRAAISPVIPLNPQRLAITRDSHVILVRAALTWARSTRRDGLADPHVIRVRG